MKHWPLVLAVGLVTALAVFVSSCPDQPSSGERARDDRAQRRPPDVELRGRDPGAAVPDGEVPEGKVPGGDMPGITIRGEVHAGWEDELLEGVRVRLVRTPSPARGTAVAEARPDGWFMPEVATDVRGEQVTGADGSFSFVVASLRGWAIFATKAGFGHAVHDTSGLKLAPGQSEVRLEVTLHLARVIRLQVVDAADRPVAGATVARYVDLCDQPPATVVRTNDEGCFEISVAEPDQLVIRAEGYGRVVEYDILDRNGAPIVLPEPYAVGGIVVDGAGVPIEGAVVWTDRAAMPLRVTGEDGQFRWDDLALESRHKHVEITARGKDRLRRRELVAPGQTDVRVVLAEPGVVTGRFVFPRNVDATPVHLRINGPRNYAHTDLVNEPVFRVEAVPPGRLRIHGEVRREIVVRGQPHAVFAYRGRTEVERLPGADFHRVDVQLEPVTISYVVARIVDPDGNPLGGAGIDVDAPWGGSSSRRTDAEGRIWTATAVVPGASTTVAPWAIVPVHNGSTSVPGEAVSVRTVADPESEPVEVVLDLDPTRQALATKLTLFLEREDGAPIPADVIPQWHVWQRWPRYDGRNPAVTGPSPSEGRWRGELVVEAGLPVHVKVWARGCANRRFDLPALLPGETTFVCRVSPESRVRGRLVTQTGRPARRYSVRAVVRPPGEPAVLSAVHDDRIGSDGSFVLDAVAVGPVHVSVARPDGTIVAQATGTTREGATLDVGELVIGTLPRLRGTVRDTDGRALGGVLIEFLDLEKPEPYLQASTRGDGRFDFTAPLRANTVARFSRYGFAPRYDALTQDLFDDAWEVQLLAPGTIVLECPAPPAGVVLRWVTAYEETCGYCLGSQGSGTRTSGGYIWGIADLPIGPIRFVLHGTRANGTRWETVLRGTVASGQPPLPLRFVSDTNR